MPSVPIHPPRSAARQGVLHNPSSNPLPRLLQTPSGLAILELQGTINIPSHQEDDVSGATGDTVENGGTTFETPIGKLMFPHYSPSDLEDTKWMKQVYLYIGQYQRMTGEVKKLAKPLAVIQRRRKFDEGVDMQSHATKHENAPYHGDELEIVEIIRFKILFPSRPEPVSVE
jgi:chromosome transmission fidelity protein 8